MFVAKRSKIAIALTIGIIIITAMNSVSAFAATNILKKGMRGSSVTQLQNDLKGLGYFNTECTGYFGDITWKSVVNFQRQNGLDADGIVGSMTFAAIERSNSGNQTVSRGENNSSQTVSRGENRDTEYLGAVQWFGNAENIYSIGRQAQVYDINTGKTFNVKRTYGYNHADTETLTAEDTRIMKEIYGGSFSWVRRPIILTIENKKIAASMAGMPHAGLDKYAANINVSNRSEGYGYGQNLDTVKSNNMDGHFDIHFLGSKTHGSNKIDANHQTTIQKAANWAASNLR